MTIDILMPALSPTMTEGNLAKWMKKEGDTVESGDVIAEIETDKATMEVEAVDEGVIGKILIEEGTESVSVNTPIAVLLEEGESASDIDTSATNAPVPAPQSVEDSTPVSMSTDVASQPVGATVENRDILWAQGHVIEPPIFDEAPFMTSTKTMTVREALREGMSEEMRTDKDIFMLGEEIAEYNGAYKVTPVSYTHLTLPTTSRV